MQFTVLWDNDGVLVDSEPLFFQATADALRQVGVELTREIFIDHSLRQGRSTFELAADRGVGAEELGRLRDERDEKYTRLLKSNPVIIEDARETLQELHGEVRMGVVTSAPREHFQAAHAGRGLVEFFDFVLTREDYDESKPAPDGYLAAIERFGVKPEQAVVIEDTERGLTAAVAAGLRCMVIPHDLTRDGSFDRAHRVLDSIRQVPAEVRTLMSGKSTR